MSHALAASPLLPESLAWVGPARKVPVGLDLSVSWFADSDDFLLAAGAFEHAFYVVELEQQGVSGLDLIRLVRRRSQGGVLALGDCTRGDVARALKNGADMMLPFDASDEDLVAAVQAVQRRCQPFMAAGSRQAWTLLEDRSVLRAPDGSDIALSGSELTLLQCFAEATDGKVAREHLVERLWGPQAGPMDNALHATVYRLRKRIESTGQSSMPVHAVARMGYEFRAPLRRS